MPEFIYSLLFLKMELTNTLVTGWASRLVNRRYSQYTIKNYIADFSMFMEFMQNRLWVLNIRDDDISMKMIEDWRTELNQTKTPRTSMYYSVKPFISPSTIQSKITAVKSFLRYINSIFNTWLDYQRIEQPRVRSPLMDVLTEDEFEQLYNIIPKIEKYRINALRSQLLVRLWYTSWLRLSEMLSLKVDDIRAWKARIVWKWDKERWAFFAESVQELLEEYLIERTKPVAWTWKTEKDYPDVFISHVSWYTFWRPLKKVTVCELMKKYSDALNIWKRITCHSLRHSFATRLLEAWVNVREIQEFLWHSDLTTTQSYCHVLTSTLVDTHKKLFK